MFKKVSRAKGEKLSFFLKLFSCARAIVLSNVDRKEKKLRSKDLKNPNYKNTIKRVLSEAKLLTVKDFEDYGYVLSHNDEDGVILKKQMPRFEMTLFYSNKYKNLRLRDNNPIKRHCTVIGSINISTREELDWLFSRVSH